MTQILELQTGITNENPVLESLRNRTVMIFGDSVDRECAEVPAFAPSNLTQGLNSSLLAVTMKISAIRWEDGTR